MVNAAFPDAKRYGFEIVHTRQRTPSARSIENLRRIESFDFFTDFPRFSFNADTRGLSRPSIFGRRLREQPQRTKKNSDGVA
jgi:hypothetical protein